MIFLVGKGVDVYFVTLLKLPVNAVENTDDYSAYINFGISITGLLVAGIAAVKKRVCDRDD